MSLPMNSVFESLFRLDPIISGITMAPILEETNGNGNSNLKEGTKLFKKNSTGSIGSNSGSNKYINNSNNGNGTPPPGRFERSGSTKSYAKNRSPLSRLWQMRRRSFSQFELSSISLSAGNVVAGIGKANSPHHYSHLNEIDLDDAGAPGFFQLIGDHWNSETDLTSQGSQRVSTTSSDDYGFLPHPQSRTQPTANKTSLTPVSSGVDDERSNVYSKESILSVSDFEEEEGEELDESYLGDHQTSSRSAFGNRSGTSGGSKRSSKLKRRKAYYREKKEGRSRSLTHIDNLDPAMLLRNEDMDSKSEPDTSHDQLLFVPPTPETRESRRKKLARSQVSSSEFFSVCFEGELGSGLEEFLPASRGMCLGDALRPLFEKKNISLSSVNVFVDSSKTPLPAPAHTDTYFVAGKNLIVRAKADGKFHSRSFKQPSRKSSQRGKHKFFSASTEDPSYSGTVDPLSSTSSLSSSAPHSQQPHSTVHGPSGIISSSSSSTSTTNTNTNQQPHSLLSSSLSVGAQSQQQQPSGFISHEGSLKVKNTKQSTRWSGLFSNSIKDNSKMDLLVEQLNNYSKNGIPRPNILPCDTDDIESNYSVDEDWKAVVSGWNDMSERSKQQQTAIWELVETEVVYLKTIKVITDLFLACLYNLQAANILNEIDRDQLFSNIPDIYKANKALWLDCIQPMVQKARDSKQPLQPSELRSGFLKFGSTCQSYTRYCLDQTKCQQYCREKYQDNEFFKAYLAWCETRKECNRLRLMDILVRPMQRMTKYSLLLKAILKHTEDPDQRKCLDDMIGSVERFVKSVNGALRSRQDAERLQGIAERIECYDVVETKDEELEAVIKSHSKLDLFHPMPSCGPKRRWLLYEGDLKIKDSFTSKMDVHCFLFTDMLLVCKPMGRKGEKMKVIRQPYVVDRLLTREFVKDPCALGLVYLNEYGTANAALTLHSNEPKLVKSWLEHIRKAQKLYADAKGKVHNTDFTGETLEEEETGGMNYLSSRSPRGGSSRASQLSSLVHSHSGSIEMNEVSSVSTRAISLEQELRGSSLSSDDGNGNEASSVGASGISGSLGKTRSLSIEAGPLRPPSPRLDRRLFMSKSPTPNTLSVQIPVPNLSGQSLPNLTAASDSSPPTYSHHSLTVPKSLLSPTQRGISYPPPSPRSLRRSHALLTSRNPPLQKSKNIVSPEKPTNTNLDVQVPEIRGVTPPSNDASPSASSPKGNSFSPSPEPCEKEFPSPVDDDVQIVHSNPDLGSELGSGTSINIGATSGIAKRLARNERSDTKRYYTAGAIEDIKKENSRDKDAAIHKRLSWNYGPQSQQQQQQLATEAAALRNRQFFSCESMVSVRSSSGVSSTSSLLHCISDLETTHEMPECTGHGGISPHPQCPASPRLHHPDVLIAVSEPDLDEECLSRESRHYRQQKYSSGENFIISGSDNLGFEDDPIEKEVNTRGPFDEHRRRAEMVGRHNSSTDSGATTDDSNSAGGSISASGGDRSKSTTVDLLDFILTDASIEASEV